MKVFMALYPLYLIVVGVSVPLLLRYVTNRASRRFQGRFFYE